MWEGISEDELVSFEEQIREEPVVSSSPSTRICDRRDRDIRVGSKVMIEWSQHGTQMVDRGIVISISDPDGDVDDEGRPYGINPSVTVEWPDGEREAFPTCQESLVYMCDWEWVCEDLEVI